MIRVTRINSKTPITIMLNDISRIEEMKTDTCRYCAVRLKSGGAETVSQTVEEVEDLIKIARKG